MSGEFRTFKEITVDGLKIKSKKTYLKITYQGHLSLKHTKLKAWKRKCLLGQLIFLEM